MPTPHAPFQNGILAALPMEAYASILPHLELVPMQLGDVIQDSGVPMGHIYFLTTAIVSLLCLTKDGASAEVAVVGNEGIVGIHVFMGGDTAINRAVVQTAGYAYRLKRHFLSDAFQRTDPLQGLLLRYTQALLTQMSQTAACNRHHSVDQQLCRWLLLRLDRLPSSELVMTQEAIANMLGVRREGVTEAAGVLQRAGLIQCCRGKIVVVDRPRLEARACECYDVVKDEYERLLPGTTSAMPPSPATVVKNPPPRRVMAQPIGSIHRGSPAG